MIWVIDASVAIRWFLSDEADPVADQVLRRVIDEPESFAVPELFAFEVFSVLCRLHPHGPRAFHDGMMPLLDGGLFRQPMTETLGARAAALLGHGLTGYDACYAALARDLGGAWLTFDRKAHARISAEGVSCCLAEGLPPGW